jgi:hypothetical protein
MKSIKLLGLLAVLSVSLVPAMAQKKNEQENKIVKQFDKTVTGLSKVDVSKSAEVSKVAATQLKDDWIVDEGLRALQALIEERRKQFEQKEKEYAPVPTRTKHLDKDLLPLVAEMPEPQSNLPLAKQAMKVKIGEDVYSKYIEKLQRVREQMAEIARKAVPDDMKDPEKAKSAAYKNAAEAEQAINNNPMIQQMGGIEKLKNMTPEQRQAMAKQMSANVKNNPTAYTGVDSDPKKAFANKMMTDPSYAARFNGMNKQQKQEEYDAFVKENGFVNNSSQSDNDKLMAERYRANTSIALDKRALLIGEHANEMATAIGDLQKRTDDYFNELIKQLSGVYTQRVAALPEVEMGEAGRAKETHPLDITYQVVLYAIHGKNAIADKAIWKRKVDMLKAVIADHNDFLGEFWGRDNTTDRLMKEKGYIPAATAVAMCDELISLTKAARYLTNQNAGWQKTYDMIVLAVND